MTTAFRMRRGGALAAVIVAHLVAAPAARAGQDAGPTEGVLMLATEGESPRPLAAVSTDVDVAITGYVARVVVDQTFRNPLPEAIEAIYVFPLPQNAAVGDMTIRVGDRTIRGEIKSRDDAREIYEEARDAGKTAALLDQERPNIFTQSVANIAPRSEVGVEIVYDVVLDYEDGTYEMAYPMTVGPRYIPGTPDGRPVDGAGTSPNTDRVPDASHITPPVASPGSRSGRDISLRIAIDAGVPVRAIESPTHDIDIDTGDSDEAVRVELARKVEIPNRDFVLRYRLAADAPTMSVLTHEDERGGYFSLSFEPPSPGARAPIRPKELVFVVDSSGSMSGAPIGMVKRAMRHALSNLGPRDSFQIIRFSSTASQLGARPMPATRENIRRALDYVAGLEADGGTEMLEGLRASLRQASGDRLRIVCFMTDGFIGNETEILSEIQSRLGHDTRLFSFGVGSSVNRYLLERMAQVGRGTVQYMLLEEPPEDQVERFYERIRAPVLTHIDIDWDGLDVFDLQPEAPPDLFAGQPVRVLGRFRGSAAGEAVIRGWLGNERVTYRVPVDFGQAADTAPVLARLWARARLRDLDLEYGHRRLDETARAIETLGLDYRLVTRFTSFVAVDDRVSADGGPLRTVGIPVELPMGVEPGPADGMVEADDAGYHESIMVEGRTLSSNQPGSWRFGGGLRLGQSTIGGADESPLAMSFHLDVDRVWTTDFALGAELDLHWTAADVDLMTTLLLRASYIGLAGGAVELVLGAGPTVAPEAEPGLTLGGGAILRTPLRGLGAELRYEHLVVGGDDADALTVGLRYTF